MRGRLSKPEALALRNRGKPAFPQDLEQGRIRYTTADVLREAGFAVIHTPYKMGEPGHHVSAVWPDKNPLDEHERDWPACVQTAFEACFTEGEG